VNTNQLYRILPIAFAAILVTTAGYTAYTYTLPLTETQTITLATIRHTATYDYTAHLKNNTYYNATTLKPGDGPVYTAITDTIDISFNHTFTAFPPPTNTSIKADVDIELEAPEKWTRVLRPHEIDRLLDLQGSTPFTLTLNKTTLDEVVDVISEEVGLRATTYNLNIRPTIRAIANVRGEVISELFTPTLTVSFVTGGDLGNVISMENLVQTKNSDQTTERTIVHEEVEESRKDALVITVISVVPLAFTTVLYLKNRPEAPKRKPLQKVIAPYQELITETTEKPPSTPHTITMNSLEDLAKTAEILARPINHIEIDGEHLFYLIDGYTKHQYTIRE
jgi:hypothetical protein